MPPATKTWSLISVQEIVVYKDPPNKLVSTQCNSFNYRPRLRGRQLNSTGVFDKYALGRTSPAGLNYAYPVSRLGGALIAPPHYIPQAGGGGAL